MNRPDSLPIRLSTLATPWAYVFTTHWHTGELTVIVTLLRHAYFDPGEPWYVRNWHFLSPDVLKRYGYVCPTDLHDLDLDRRPTEEEVIRFIEPLRKIIDEPRLVLQQLDY